MDYELFSFFLVVWPMDRSCDNGFVRSQSLKNGLQFWLRLLRLYALNGFVDDLSVSVQ